MELILDMQNTCWHNLLLHLYQISFNNITYFSLTVSFSSPPFYLIVESVEVSAAPGLLNEEL